MTPVLQSAQLFLLAGLAFVAIGSLASAVLMRALGGHLARWEPRARHRGLVLFAGLPALIAGVLMLSASLPAIVSLVVPGFDHCTVHDDAHAHAHAHLCFVHLPKMGVNTAVALLLVFLISYSMLRIALASLRIVRTLQVLDVLAATGERRRDLGVTIVESARPLCLAAGLLRPRILLSRGFAESLTADERVVVLAHERAHVERRDALVASMVRALASLHLPSAARWLVRELEVAAEQACDEAAGRVVGDRLAVASAILAVERAVQDASAQQFAEVAVAFGQRAIERRVESLLSEPGSVRSLRTPLAWFGAAAIGVLATTTELHHLTESLLSFITY